METKELVQRDAELAMERAQLRSVLDNVPDAVIVVDEQGIIQRFGAGAERTLGYASRAAIGRNYAALLAPSADAPTGDDLALLMRSGRLRHVPEVMNGRVRVADGKLIPVEVRIGEVVDSDEQLFTIFLRDITDRIEGEDRISRLGEQLAHVSRVGAMGEMAAGIAHELNQPLTAAANFLGTAKMIVAESPNDAQLAELLESARTQLMRAGSIIRRMRDFLSGGDIDIRAEPIEQTIRDAVALVMMGRIQFDVRVGFAFDRKATTMLADRVQVQQVIVNLLRNAIDALQQVPPDRRDVLVKSRVIDDMVEISVSDTGPGIAPAILKRLYEPFKTTKGGGGMGVGLSICRQIVEAHGGAIEAESRPEGGAVFRFTLPLFSQEEVVDA